MDETIDFLKQYLDPMIFGILGFMALIVIWFSTERAIFFYRLEVYEYNDIKELEEDVTRNLTALYIVYSNAPYVGLLGTVVGIMVVFHEMSGSGGLDVKSVTLGLSLALKATALGLVVAIPTLMIYNAFLRVADKKVNRYHIEKGIRNEN